MFKFMRKVIDIFLIVSACLFALWAVANLFLPHPQGLKWLADELAFVTIFVVLAWAIRKARNAYSDNPPQTKPYRLSKPKFALLALAMAGAWAINYFAQRSTHPGAAGLWTGTDTYYTVLFGGALCAFAFTTFRKPLHPDKEQ